MQLSEVRSKNSILAMKLDHAAASQAGRYSSHTTRRDSVKGEDLEAIGRTNAIGRAGLLPMRLRYSAAIEVVLESEILPNWSSAQNKISETHFLFR